MLYTAQTLFLWLCVGSEVHHSLHGPSRSVASSELGHGRGFFFFKQKDNEDIRSQGKEERIQKENFRVDKMNHFYQLDITTYQLQHEGSVTKKK